MQFLLQQFYWNFQYENKGKKQVFFLYFTKTQMWLFFILFVCDYLILRFPIEKINCKNIFFYVI